MKKIIFFSLIFFFLMMATSNVATPVRAVEKVISIKPEPESIRVDGPIPGVGGLQCTIGGGYPVSKWGIKQWKNENSLCNGANSAPSECPGASIVKATGTARFCLWNSQKKVQTAVNSVAMTNKGCTPNASGANAANPGGYSVYLSNSLPETDGNYWNDKGYSLENMEKIILSTGYQTNYYAAETCSNGNPPVATAYLNVIVNEVNGPWDGVNTIFFQTVLYDNRSGWQENKTRYFNCALPSSGNEHGFVVVSEPIGKWGMAMNKPGEAEKYYEWDILPGLKESIQTCLGNKDLSRFWVDAVFMGNELENATIMTNTFTDPKLRLVTKTPTPAPLPGDLNGDTHVDNTDYQLFLTDFGKTGSPGWIPADIDGNGKVDIFDYNILVGSFGR